uniref:FH2 domain-containing protein n=1 Tax=Meloidogyne enterolobii TaxID=390850 RepID=A0A6V7TWU6_MELEN|nr:unnamed protein product [Meloidogyne enterolobii]
MISNNNSTEPTPSSSSSQHISFKDLCKSLIKEETNFEEGSDNNNNGYLMEREGSPNSKLQINDNEQPQQLFSQHLPQFPISLSSTNPSAAALFPLSAASLFSLLENGFERTPNGEEENTTPIENLSNSSFEVRERNESEFVFNNNESIESVVNNNFSNNNNSNIISIANNEDNNPSPNIFGIPQNSFNGATPIDQILQISRQLFGDNIAKQQHLNNNSNTIMGRKGGNNGSSNGRQEENNTNTMTASDRKRTYPYTFQFCVLCQKNVHSSKLPCHIRQCHVGKPMFQCPVCDFTSTYSKNNVKSHMVSLHGMAGDPISFMDAYAGQVDDFMKECFPNVRGRGRPVHGRFGSASNISEQPAPSKTCQKKQQAFKQNILGSPGGDTVVSSEDAASIRDGGGGGGIISSPTNTNEFWALNDVNCQNLDSSPPPNNNSKNIISRRRQMSNSALVASTQSNNNNNNIQQKQHQHNYRNRVGSNGHSNNTNNNPNSYSSTSRLFNRHNKRRCTSPSNQKTTILVEQQPAVPTNLFNSSTPLFGNNGGGGIGIAGGNGGEGGGGINLGGNLNINSNELMGAVLEKITSTNNGFGFNPFIYLQQLNGFFPAFQNNATPNIASSNVQHAIRNANENNCANFKQKDSNRETFSPSSIGINTSEGPQTMLLKECLSISQKFLKEINDGEMMTNSSKNNLNKNGHQNNKKKKIGEEGGQIYENYNNLGNNIADNPNCHSSSSTTASPLPTTNFHHLNTLNNNFDIHSEEPLYFPQSPALCKILEGPGLEKTVFNTFTSSNELIEKFDLSIFENLLEKQSIASGSLLTPEQKNQVSNVRAQLGLQSFEVMFAVHRLDSNILKPAQVHLVECIAPTKSDIRRFALFEQQHSNNNNSGNILFDKDEQFVIELSKIERLREKLAVMAFVGEFNERLAQLNKQIQCLSSAATLLYNSPHFHMLLHLLLIAINLLSGDFTIKLIKAFRPSKLQSICSFIFPNGFSLLQILAKIVEKHYPELANFVSNEKSLVIGEAAKVNFACISKELHLLERGQSLVEEELIYLTEETTSNNGCGKSQQQQQLAAFSAHLTTEIVHLKESMQSLKNQLTNTLNFFGEIEEEQDYENNNKYSSNNFQKFHPERFFEVIANFLGDLNEELKNH